MILTCLQALTVWQSNSFSSAFILLKSSLFTFQRILSKIPFDKTNGLFTSYFNSKLTFKMIYIYIQFLLFRLIIIFIVIYFLQFGVLLNLNYYRVWSTNHTIVLLCSFICTLWKRKHTILHFKNIISYLSNAIAQRFKMEAVQQRTSLVSHILQTMLPKCHFPTTCNMTFNGKTTIDTVRSETARLTMK